MFYWTSLEIGDLSCYPTFWVHSAISYLLFLELEQEALLLLRAQSYTHSFLNRRPLQVKLYRIVRFNHILQSIQRLKSGSCHSLADLEPFLELHLVAAAMLMLLILLVSE